MSTYFFERIVTIEKEFQLWFLFYNADMKNPQIIQWTDQQSDALFQIKTWLQRKNSQQVFRVFGWAGTGKTTMAVEVSDFVQGDVIYATYTGKASLILQTKGCRDAQTLHSLIYRGVEDPATGLLAWTLNPQSPLAYTKLLVVDEVSMVNEEMAKDILSFGCKVLVLGDPFQLPPISGAGYFTDKTPDVMLTDIRRQAKDNPIIALSIDVREGRRLTYGSYGSSKVIPMNTWKGDVMIESLATNDQTLCGKNATRFTFNGFYRDALELNNKMNMAPVRGDKLVCLKNNRLLGLMNGSLWEVHDTKLRDKTEVWLQVKSLDGLTASIIETSTHIKFFEDKSKELDWREKKRMSEFDYGYALTCHRAQGSQWDNVLVYDESNIFREFQARHLYTAITRAKESVEVIM